MNVDILKTDSQNDDFAKLISLLDDDLYRRYGELQKQYEKHNKVAQINNVVIIYRDKIPVACGSFKEQDSHSVELKRIFVVNDQRGQGLAKLIVSKLEEIAKSRGYKYAVLETGIKQHEAINLYKSCGYYTIANYEPYTENTNSICMKKNL
ncbi:GNAT family N-acetyltransferase [Desulfosporosinus sp. BICA1-9]|uniref:GNAT family N-acetyltransferase n=1 Tax=Desulfosporosinus sp. BICA1-9 TaxID=1531958 RepID=UPI00054BEEF0|nr:GNAT family N-acetyltransferase [Desulfosporosinus sp. BICA1-9]KJS82354.1 MAG: GNAT family acetyltransferase [Desulfosporosinus sp. BICA1-9]